jgi:hypothetical protein
MKHFVITDNRDIIRSYTNTPDNSPEWKQVDTSPSSFGNILKYFNGKILDTGQPLTPPNSWMIWDNNANIWTDPRTAEEKTNYQWTQVRNQRDALLIESDWTDTLSAKARLGDALYNAWQNYRQALRDITNQADPFTITWPTKPQ